MKFKVKNLVRGTGLVYFNVKVEGTFGEDQPTFIAKAENGNEIPCIQYDASKWDELEDYVLVLPLLHVKAITISCKDCEQCSTFTSSQIKWMSRWNYKAQKDIAHTLRDFEKPIWANNIRFHYKFIMDVSGKPIKLMKGFVNYPHYSKEPELKVLDSEGNEIEDADLYTFNVANVKQEGHLRQEVPFTLRMPQGKEFCIYAKSQDEAHSAIMFFDAPAMECYQRKHPCRWDVCNSQEKYDEVVLERELFLKTEAEKEFTSQEGPKFSIVVPLYKTPIQYFNEMVKSVQSQFYKNWELILVNASPEDAELKTAVENIEDERVKVIEVLENGGISANTNVGIDACTGDYIGFLDHDDTLDPRALSFTAAIINKKPETDVVYTDQDKLDTAENFIEPTFKPSFNIDLLRCWNYVSHFLAVRTTLAKANKFNANLDGSQDHDFILRLSEQTNKIEHIEEVLYHWRQAENSTASNPNAKNYAHTSALTAIQQHFDRLGLNANVEETSVPFLYNPVYHVSGSPKVSIVIPNKNGTKVLKKCIDSIYEKSAYTNFEIIIVENGSNESSLFEYYKQLKQERNNVKIIEWKDAFNYSKVCNFGAKHTEGEFLLFLNNDTEVIEPRWLDYMVGICQREDVGAVGAKLLYPDDTVQHAGVFFPRSDLTLMLGGPEHTFVDVDRDDFGYCFRASLKSDVEAVTGACMMTSKGDFDKFGQFDEDYAIDYSDVDYCFKITNAGKKVVFDPKTVLYHHESLTIGTRSTNALARWTKDIDRLRSKWPEKFIERDNLSSYILTLE